MKINVECNQCKQEADRAFCESHYEQMLEEEQREGENAVLSDLRDMLVLAECELPGEGKNTKQKFYHLSEEDYKKLFLENGTE